MWFWTMSRSAPMLVVIRPAPLDADLLAHRDLDVVHVLLVPDRLEDAVGETEDEDVLHGLLAEVMVNAEDLPLGEGALQKAVQLARARQVMAERLLDDQPRPGRSVLVRARQARLAKPFRDRTEEVRLRGEVKDIIAGDAVSLRHPLEAFAERLIVLRLMELPAMVGQSRREPRPEVLRLVRRFLARERFDALAHRLGETGVCLRPAREPDHGELFRLKPLPEKAVDRRDQLPLRQVAGGAENHQYERLRHGVAPPRRKLLVVLSFIRAHRRLHGPAAGIISPSSPPRSPQRNPARSRFP